MGKRRDKQIKARLIFNPYSGRRGDPEARLREAVGCLARHGIAVDVAIASPAERATPLARAAVRSGYKLIIAMGGDGTVEAAARGLIGSKGRLGILPAGTYNNVATSLGIPKDLEGACRVLEQGNRRRIDVGRVKSKKRGTLYFLEAATMGLEAALYPVGNAVAKRQLSRLVDAVGTLIHYPLPKVKVQMKGGGQVEASSLLVVIANTPNFGATYLVAPDASLDDGKLDVSVFAGFSKMDILAYFAEVSGEHSAGSGHVQRYQARKLKIRARPRQLVMADNQRLGKGTVTIQILPRALRVIAPEQPAVPQVPENFERLPITQASLPPADGKPGNVPAPHSAASPSAPDPGDVGVFLFSD
jgi:diacylglycerol kinase (ATP)